MKKILFTIVSIAALAVACNPVEKRDVIGDHITADEMRAQSSVTIWQENGKNVNYVTCETHAPVNAVWSSVTQFQGAVGELQLFALGEQKIKLQGLCADGTVLETEFSVNVEDMAYPVAPQWGMLTGGTEKAWTWTSDGWPNCWGNGGYHSGDPESIATGGGDWWGVTPDGIAGQCADYGFDKADGEGATMTFTLQGTNIIKSSGATGKFAFSMKDNANNIGTFQATGCGILFPCQINVGAKVTTFEIVRLTNDHLDLIYASDGTGDWSECTHWRFVPAK